MNPVAAAKTARGGTVDAAEIARFDAMAQDWWNPHGSFRPLHRLNPARLGFIREQLIAHIKGDPQSLQPFAGLRVLDIGCGGGLIAEPMRRLGAEVTGIDMAAEGLEIARAHAAETGLDIQYRHGAAEDLVAEGQSFDIVLALEVVEHVPDRGAFFAACGSLTKKGGALIAATLNRTPQAFLMAIVGAEYVLRWLPRGTHDWQKFVRPSELARDCRNAGLDIRKLKGLSYSIPRDSWVQTDDLGVNYMAFAVKA